MFTIISSILESGSVLLLATLGSLIVQRVGLLNLGIEGFFAIAAFTAYLIAIVTKNLVLAFFVAIISSLALNLIFTILTIHLRLNHIVSGLAIAIFGIGISYTFGKDLVGISVTQYVILPKLVIQGFSIDPIVISSFVITYLLWYMIYKTKLGYKIRVIGEDPYVADLMGINVVRIRYLATCLEGILVGYAAAYYSLSVIPQWTEGVTLGKGWLAIALAMFSLWNPLYAILGSYIVASIKSLVYILPVFGITLPAEILHMFPYVFTIIVLAIISRIEIKRRRIGIPQALAKIYSREEKARKYV